jgi:probable rRNA maturation factor
LSLSYHIFEAPADIRTEQWDKLFSKWLSELQPQLKADVYVQFVSQDEIRELSRVHRGLDKPTDVLSFTYDPPIQGEADTQVGAEIVICVAVAQEHVDRVGSTLENELATLFVHGLLHIAGLDHQTDVERDEFQRMTRAIMESVGLSEVNLWSD